MQASVAISYFHRKIGPIVYYSYPVLVLDEKEKIRLADIMDQAFEEGFFTHKFSNLYSMNYYFEIPSDWARGNKEMLMLSIIVDITPDQDVEQTINAWCEDFSNRLKLEPGAFKAFYEADDPQVSESDEAEMKEHSKNLEIWLQELYWLAIEELREKTEEEKWAEIMSQPQIFKIIHKLAKGPLKKTDLERWFYTLFPEYEFDEIFSKLEEEKFIFANDIGHESFVLLVKDVKITRVPPAAVIDLKEDNPELEDLTQIYINEVADFFESYKPNPIDGFQLFKLFANPKIYNVISQLRAGPLAKEKVLSMVSEKAKNTLQKSLDLLEDRQIIQEFSYSGEKLYLLKTDVILQATFPDYLKKLLPQDPKSQTKNSSVTEPLFFSREEEELEREEHENQIIMREAEDLILEDNTDPDKDLLGEPTTPSFSVANADQAKLLKSMESNQNGDQSRSSYLFNLEFEGESSPQAQAQISEQFKKLLEKDEGGQEDDKHD